MSAGFWKCSYIQTCKQSFLRMAVSGSLFNSFLCKHSLWGSPIISTGHMCLGGETWSSLLAYSPLAPKFGTKTEYIPEQSISGVRIKAHTFSRSYIPQTSNLIPSGPPTQVIPLTQGLLFPRECLLVLWLILSQMETKERGLRECSVVSKTTCSLQSALHPI